MSTRKRMAFVDLSNYVDWPMGGMLEYELVILKHLVKLYDVDIWGVSVNGVAQCSIIIDGKQYPVNIWGNVKTGRRIIPNYYRGFGIYSCQKSRFKEYDIVYAHTGTCLIALSYMVDKKRTKLVYHQHGLNHKVDYSLHSLIQRPALYMAQKLADLVLVVSDPISVKSHAQKMRRYTHAKFAAIGSPIDLSRFDAQVMCKKIEERRDLKTKHFLYTGRLTVYKQPKCLVEAMRRYVDEVNDHAVLKIAGTGEELEPLKAMIERYGLSSNVKVLGFVPHEQIFDLLQQADVFLTASRGEGVSVSVLEAYASGLPVVCYKVPGLEGQVIDGVTGFFAEDNSSEAFFKAMLRVDEKRAFLAKNCLEEAKKYDDSMISLRIYSQIESLFKKEN